MQKENAIFQLTLNCDVACHDQLDFFPLLVLLIMAHFAIWKAQSLKTLLGP